jgi:class 3 adenylate cyclase/tetratricopeptide (TPR) repeat protein
VNAGETIVCSACGELTPAVGRFCINCATPIQQTCPNCGAPAVPGARFCMQCATPLGSTGAGAGAASMPTPGGGGAAISERRLVSVLFADLVGFTTLSEHRDPEEVRDLLSRYFDRCRSLIERYGGTVEKFIGDAVMAVWGTPVAREDDPERAVRAALALTQAVNALGQEVGMPELRVRAGVLTGNAAVEVGAESEGMVLGDTVNTAARLQSIAAPGTVLVDDVTRRASEAAIAYEDAGTHQVKGREQPVRAWTALRVVAGAGGARRTAGLEAPFVGRDRELQTIIDLAERSARERCATHIAVIGEAGSGKSRLLWEFFKYLDGIEELRWWHQGRSLAYGEGVGYWSLAEMVRSRAGIVEEDDPAAAREKLRETVEQFVPDARERRLVEPRLAHLLRLDERPDADRADLFSGWRLFFERLSEEAPVILAFEDLQWADSGLLDFVDYLLEWSADFPIFVLTLGRLELRERRPDWRPLSLGSMEPEALAAVLEGLAPGLPEELVAEIARRAEGIPLYAVETIRMLQDRGVLVQEGNRYIVTGDVSELDVPETLQALVASRLDNLSAGERSLLQDASVLGQSFTSSAAAVLSGRPEPEVKEVLDRLVGKQVLARDDDPRSPERGQYVFLQALLRTVAYGTLSRRARKARHVAAARHLELTWPGEARDIAEVLAAHYLEAIRAEPEADDAPALRSAARATLSAAGRAAVSLALGPEADRYFEQAAELAEDDLLRAELLEQAGRALWHSADPGGAEARLRRSMDLYERAGKKSGGSAAVSLANVMVLTGRIDDARALLEPFRAEDEAEVDPIVHAEALAELGRVLVLSGDLDGAAPLFEDALTTLEINEAWSSLATALVSRTVYLVYRRRRQEGIGVLRHALAMAEERGLTAVALRARFNLAAVWLDRDQLNEAVNEVREGLVLARERGDRAWESGMLGQLVSPLVVLGLWEEAVPVADALMGGELTLDANTAGAFLLIIAVARGDEATWQRCLDIAQEGRESTYIDTRACALLTFARDAVERGRPEEAIAYASDVLVMDDTAGEFRSEAFAVSVEAAIAIADDATAAELVAFVDRQPPSRATRLLRAGQARLRAELAHRGGDDEATARHEDAALEILRAIGARPQLAHALAERAVRRHDEGALAEARQIYRDLKAARWLAALESGTELRAQVRPAAT